MVRSGLYETGKEQHGGLWEIMQEDSRQEIKHKIYFIEKLDMIHQYKLKWAVRTVPE